MKSLKLFLIISFAFLLGAAGAAGYVWYLVQDTLTQEEVPVSNSATEQEPAAAASQETQSGSVAETVPAGGLSLPPDALSEQQKNIAESVGIDVDAFVMTPQMVQCAEEKLGTARIMEIMAGDSPSVIEVARLAPCL